MVASISLSRHAEYYPQPKYHFNGALGEGRWFGEAAEKLGFSGAVTLEQLKAAYEGFGPDGTLPLVQIQGDKARQPAWDITLSAPKWLSVLWSVCGPVARDRIEQSIIRATERTAIYINDEAVFTRRGKGGHIVQRANALFAFFLHCTSRAQDPQLHVHVVVPNICLRADGTTGTLRSRDLYLHKMAIGALFRTELAYILQGELGLSISADGWSFKVDGVPKGLCDAQSKRRKVIEAIAKEEGWTSPQVLEQLAVRTRDTKGTVSLEDCFQRWQETAAEYGFTQDKADALLSCDGSQSINTGADQQQTKDSRFALERAFAKAVATVSAFNAYSPERDFVREVATAAQGMRASATEVIKAVKQDLSRFENCVITQDSVYKQYSTRENIAAEKELIERSEKSRTATTHIATEKSVRKAKAIVERKLSKRSRIKLTLTNDQEQTLHHITREEGSVKIAAGHAGTGKTQVLEAAHLAWKGSGKHVIGATVTGRAAIGLQRTTGIPSVTVALLLQSLNPSAKDRARQINQILKQAIKGAYYDSKAAGRWVRNPWKEALREVSAAIRNIGKDKKRLPTIKLTSKSILVIDEAAMLPTKALLAIKRECDKVGAKLVLVGDRLQLPPIEAGGPFWSIASRVGYVSLTTIVRQRQEWMKAAIEHVINNEPRQALEVYAANDALHLLPTQRAAIDKLVVDYAKLRPQEINRSLVLTSTNEEAYQVNAAIQAQRRAARQLGLTAIKLPNGERVHKHDRVLLTLNDYKLGVRNGFLGTVEAIHRTRGILGPGSLTIRFDDLQKQGIFARDNSRLTIDLKQYPNVRLGHAVTTYKAQGITVENSFVLLGDSMPSKELTFTQLTRASHKTALYGADATYGDSLQYLVNQMNRSAAKDLAHDHTIELQRQALVQQEIQNQQLLAISQRNQDFYRTY